MPDSTKAFLNRFFPDERERVLLAGLQTAPDDAALRLVYSDYLEDRGGALDLQRAAFLRRSVANPEDAELDALRPQVGWEWLSASGATLARLCDLQERTASEEARGGWRDSLTVTSAGGLLDVHFNGANHTDGFDGLLKRLVQPELALVVRSVRLDFCPERGFANGSSFVPLDRLSEDPIVYPWLETFAVCRNLQGLVVNDYDEEGAIARLLHKCPALTTLAMPSAPDASFFQVVPRHPLRSLAISAGYDAQRFLYHLSRATCFPDLRHLEFRDYWQFYLNGWEESCTSFADYRAFFRSPLLAQLETVVLEVTSLEPEQIAELRGIRSDGVTLTEWRG